MARTPQNIVVKRTWVASPAIMRFTPIGFSAYMAAKEPPTPMNAREAKSPRINSVANSLGPMCQRRAKWWCC